MLEYQEDRSIIYFDANIDTMSMTEGLTYAEFAKLIEFRLPVVLRDNERMKELADAFAEELAYNLAPHLNNYLNRRTFISPAVRDQVHALSHFNTLC